MRLGICPAARELRCGLLTRRRPLDLRYGRSRHRTPPRLSHCARFRHQGIFIKISHSRHTKRHYTFTCPPIIQKTSKRSNLT